MDEGGVAKTERRRVPRKSSEVATMAERDLDKVKVALLAAISGGNVDNIARSLAGEMTKRGMENIRDVLTGAWSRGHVRAELSHELKSVERRMSGLGVCVIDMDYFKRINDDEPDKHSAGDRTLQAFYRMVQEEWGEAYILGRYGGDEWLWVLPGVTVEELELAGKELGAKVNTSLAKEAKLSRKTVTISIGAVMWNGQESMDGLIKRADELVYRAKEKKDRMVVQGDQEEEPRIISYEQRQPEVVSKEVVW